ncbi:MAG: hypothetical protein ACK55I_19135, partial [bacterium]
TQWTRQPRAPGSLPRWLQNVSLVRSDTARSRVHPTSCLQSLPVGVAGLRRPRACCHRGQRRHRLYRRAVG